LIPAIGALPGAVDRDGAKNYCAPPSAGSAQPQSAATGATGEFKDLPNHARLLAWVRPASIVRRLAPVVLTAALVACTGGHQVETNADSGNLFAHGIEEITDLYIEPISGQKLVTVGAMNLAKLDQRLGVASGENKVTLTYDGMVVASFSVPPEIGATDAGQTVTALIAAAKKASGHVASLPEDAIDKAVFDGMTGALDRFSRY